MTLDSIFPTDLTDMIMSYLEYMDILMIIPEHRIFKKRIDKYGLRIPKRPYKGVVWRWRSDIHPYAGIRINARSMVGLPITECVMNVIECIIPSGHSACVNAMTSMVSHLLYESDTLLMSPDYVNFIVMHWKLELSTVMVKRYLESIDIRNGLGICIEMVLQSLLRCPVFEELHTWTVELRRLLLLKNGYQEASKEAARFIILCRSTNNGVCVV